MRTGYHITAYKNLKSILKYGLVPYSLSDQPVAQKILEEFGFRRGIFLWPNLKGKAHLAGCILDRIAKKNTWTVVVLKVRYERENCLSWIGAKTGVKVILTHLGSIEQLKYHRARPFELLVKTCKNVEIHRVINVRNLLAGRDF